MGKGIDELLEWLLIEICFSGLEGLSALNFVKAVKLFYQTSDDTNDVSRIVSPEIIGSQTVDEDDIEHASVVWKWLIARGDVIVTPARLSQSSLREALALSKTVSNAEADDSPTQNPSGPSSAGGKPRSKGKQQPLSKPAEDKTCLHLSEERQWNAIAGHGPDLKRIPPLEWKALVAIASVREEGILQGDLGRLTGQDKRSLPTRTDSLARKGYIIKQASMLRGCRTSKIWLAQFAENAKEEISSEGLPLERLDLSRETLTQSWDPVPFAHYYNGGKIDYLAISQAFLAVAKAYGALRYCDLRTKLDVVNKIPQMRSLAKSSRWFARIGVIRFEPMQSRNSSKLYRDCIRFVRDPTEEEWSVYRATPKSNLKIPSARIGVKSKEETPSDPSQDPSTFTLRQGAKQKREAPSEQALPSPALIKLSAWTPYKPMINTVFEIIKRSGPEGTSNTDIGTFILGFPYRKWTASMTTLIGLPRPHPPHLQCFEVSAKLSRVGKTNRYSFVATGPDSTANPSLDQIASVSTERPSPAEDFLKSVFPQPDPSKFQKQKPRAAVKGQKKQLGQAPKVNAKRRFIVEESSSDEGDQPNQRIPKLNVQTKSLPPDESDQQDNAVEVAPPRSPGPPGIFIGVPCSLDAVKARGRPRKSIVVIFRFPVLRGLDFKKAEPGSSKNHNSSDREAEIPTEDNQPSPAAESQAASKGPTKRGRGRGRQSLAGGAKPYKCDKCGNSWKNLLGLQYHQRKSQSPCNPDWVPPPVHLKPRRKFTRDCLPTDDADENGKTTKPKGRGSASNLEKPLPSTRPKLAMSQTPFPEEGPWSRPNTIVVSPVQLRNMTEIPSTKSRGLGVERKKGRLSEGAAKGVPRTPSKTSRTERSRDDITDESVNPTELSTPARQPTADASLGAPPKATGNSEENSSTPVDMKQEAAPGASSAGTAPATASNNPSNEMPITNGTARRQQAFPATVKRMKSVIAGRRERTREMVKSLLARNGHVFPGGEPLYLVMVSEWIRDYEDFGPPEWKAFRTILKKMENSNIIKRDQFAFIDKTGDFRTTSVVSTVLTGKDVNDARTIPKKVAETKNKAMELYPEFYIPTGFTLTQTQPELLDAIAEKYKDTGVAKTRGPQTISLVEGVKVATLNYEEPTFGKRKLEELVDFEEPDSPEHPRKRKRPEDARRSVSFMWSLRQNKSTWKHGCWDQCISYLQDLETGTWSVLPEQKGEACNMGQFWRPSNAAAHQRAYRLRVRRRLQSSAMAKQARMRADAAVIDALVPGVRAALERISSIQFIGPGVGKEEHTTSEDEEDDEEEEENEDEEHETSLSSAIDESQAIKTVHTDNTVGFAPPHEIRAIGEGIWPSTLPRDLSKRRFDGSITMTGAFPDARWFLMQNLPQNAQEMIESPLAKPALQIRPKTKEGEFDQQLTRIEAWELSPEAIYLQHRGNVAPLAIFINLSPDPGHKNLQPITAEWAQDLQYSNDNLPEEILDASSEDDVDFDLLDEVPRKRRKYTLNTDKKRYVKRRDGNFTERRLLEIPKTSGARWNKYRIDESLERAGETELIHLIVMTRKLLGGVDKLIDWGLIITIYPEWSLSGLRRFWTRIGKERANHIEAFTIKFESAFLEAYEKGEIAPIDYDALESYDWKALVAWAAKLKTHSEASLPTTRQQLQKKFVLAEPKRREENWRHRWYEPTASVLLRMDCAASVAVTVPADGSKSSPDKDLQLARSWVRALCNNTNRDTVGEDIRDALMHMSDRTESSLNKLLERSVEGLLEARVIARVHGKGMGQFFRLNTFFERRALKYPYLYKFTQATAFKAELDNSFRAGKGFILPYNANSGTIMAMFSLQAYGRIRLEEVEFPHKPFGFEPSNYEGRKYPKHYYQWDVRLVPTDSYVYDDDLAVVAEAKNLAAPQQGPHGEIPIWYDFFGNLEPTRWIQWLCMVAFALATKGPLSAASAVDLLRPVVEEFEARLILGWLDKLGLLERAYGSQACTVGEWWWLAIGKLVDTKGKGIARVRDLGAMETD